MSIQSNINTGLSLVTLLGSQSEALKERRAFKKEAKKASTLEEALKTVDPGDPREESLLRDIQGSYEKQFEMKPGSETYNALQNVEDATPETFDTEAKAEVRNYMTTYFEKQQRAQQALQQAQETKRNTRRNFIDYMKDEPTSFGSKFGELDLKVQKALAKQYSSKDRKKIMDTKDAARNEQK